MSTPARLVEATRAAQGLPRTVEDPGILAKIATLMNSAERRWRRDYPDVTDADVAGWVGAVDRAARNVS